nr:MAG TPA: hypothetical protein [Caudoviricetes sp.]
MAIFIIQNNSVTINLVSSKRLYQPCVFIYSWIKFCFLYYRWFKIFINVENIILLYVFFLRIIV